ncbi:unnamed protein product [Closterium sp. NIES-54]
MAVVRVATMMAVRVATEVAAVVSGTCGEPHTQHRCFSCLDVAWCAEFGDEVERPHWAELLMSAVAIFDLDYDAILAAMYVLSVSAEGDHYLCVPPDPGIEAAALGASESSLPGLAEALHTFRLDSSDPSLFLRTDTSLPPFYVLVYVDKLVFATANTEALALVKLELQKRDTCTDLGELRSYLGLQITRDRARCTITLT